MNSPEAPNEITEKLSKNEALIIFNKVKQAYFLPSETFGQDEI